MKIGKTVFKFACLLLIVLVAYIIKDIVNYQFISEFATMQMSIDGGQIYYDAYEKYSTICDLIFGIIVLTSVCICVMDITKYFKNKGE